MHPVPLRGTPKSRPRKGAAEQLRGVDAEDRAAHAGRCACRKTRLTIGSPSMAGQKWPKLGMWRARLRRAGGYSGVFRQTRSTERNRRR